MLKDMAAAAEPWAVAATAISKAAVERAARLAATVLASVAENECDHVPAAAGPGPRAGEDGSRRGELRGGAALTVPHRGIHGGRGPGARPRPGCALTSHSSTRRFCPR